MRRIALAALADYPVRQLTSMISETAQQLALVETGAGVVNWVWNTYDMIETYAPAAVPAMQAARQQRTGISFALINDLQVPLALLCMALLPLLAFVALRRKGFTDIGELNAAATLADPRQCRGVRRARHRASPLRRAHGLDRRARRPAHRHARRHAHRHAPSPPACGTEIVTPQCASHFVLGEVRCISPAPRSWPNSRRPENCASPLRWRPRRRRNSPSRTATPIAAWRSRSAVRWPKPWACRPRSSRITARARSRIRPPITAGTWPSCRWTTSARNSSTSATPTTCCKAPSWWRPAPR